MSDHKNACWVCGATQLKLWKKSNVNKVVKPVDMAITNADYGVTFDIFKCPTCRFMQCSHNTEVLNLYVNLQDEDYENTRQERFKQLDSWFKIIKRYKTKGHLLDIGAGSGILVEKAMAQGFDALGIEPSHWLVAQAHKHHLPVIQGIFPHPDYRRNPTVVTITEVIEHIKNPRELLQHVHAILENDGIVLMVTPDVGSCVATLLGKWWWHFRLAHIGYFNKESMRRMAKEAGFEIVHFSRPAVYLNCQYVLERLAKYLPFVKWIKLPNKVQAWEIPINLGDSMLCVLRKI